MKTTLIKQIEFEHWANAELLTHLKIANDIEERTLLLFSHILSASNMWLSRVKGDAITTTLFQQRTIIECEELLNYNTQQWLAYLKNCNDATLSQAIEFVSQLDGVTRIISITDAILHIVHHSSYHRGQIVSQLKGKVDKLPFITYLPFASTIKND